MGEPERMTGWWLASAAAGAPWGCPLPDPPGVEVCPAAEVTSRVVLLGDAGLGDTWSGGVPSPCGRDPVLALAGACAAEAGGVVVVLGDASYGRRTIGAQVAASISGRTTYGGIPPCRGDGCIEQIVATGEGAALEHRQLLAQLDVSREAGVPVWVVPGNHDWARGPGGVYRARAMIEAYAVHHEVDTRMLPDGAGHTRFLHCVLEPNVAAVRVGGQSVVAFDSARAFRCPEAQPALGAALWRAVAGEIAAGQRVLVADHHPATSHGQHHAVGRVPQDRRHPAYERFVRQVLAPPAALDDLRVVLASGHEHHLEVVDVEDPAVGGVLQIVSGAGTLPMAGAGDWHGCDPGQAAAALSPGAGFVAVDVLADGGWTARVVDVTAPAGRQVCPVRLDAPDGERGVCRTGPTPPCR
jgi:hypothetical protein